MKIAIIGGSGKMGRWFASFLLKEGKEVIITGRNEKKLEEAKRQLGVEIAPNVEAVKTADVVLLSVPIDNLEEVVEQLCPFPQSYFKSLRKACQAAKVSINLSLASVPLLLMIYIKCP